ncbi:MAG: Asp23/Gls24 family envelope stress response protein [Oscillospiraceae bacterium]|nr:Asp23/Gls24 family envelope stress response protein [Oscillospiraceae bacterium]
MIEHTVTSCFGVADLNDSSPFQTVMTRLFPGDIKRGIQLRIHRNQLEVDLHILTCIGANMNAITASIRNKVRYAVEQATGIAPAVVNVYIDGIRS